MCFILVIYPYNIKETNLSRNNDKDEAVYSNISWNIKISVAFPSLVGVRELINKSGFWKWLCMTCLVECFKIPFWWFQMSSNIK